MIKVHHIRSFFLWRWLAFFVFILKKVRLHPTTVLSGKISSFLFMPGVKAGPRTRFILSGAGQIKLNADVWISSDVEMETSGMIVLGEGTSVQRRATINGDVTLGAGCIIAPNVFISSGTHPFREYKDLPIREQERLIVEERGSLASLHRQVKIGNDCWLGVNAVVCPGVHIGNGCVIGANAVVTHDLPDFSIAVGSPARVVGNRKTNS
ncbi:MAG: hypothetical protein MI751_00225 [Pseudomonadales bacterium]|nr:hypothetical protein [Pseudomonadales bacterium]